MSLLFTSQDLCGTNYHLRFIGCNNINRFTGISKSVSYKHYNLDLICIFIILCCIQHTQTYLQEDFEVFCCAQSIPSLNEELGVCRLSSQIYFRANRNPVVGHLLFRMTLSFSCYDLTGNYSSNEKKKISRV